MMVVCARVCVHRKADHTIQLPCCRFNSRPRKACHIAKSASVKGMKPRWQWLNERVEVVAT